MSRQEETHTETGCKIKRETDAAVQIVDKEGELIWIPLSQVHNMTRDPKAAQGDAITMTAWIARQKGLL